MSRYSFTLPAAEFEAARARVQADPRTTYEGIPPTRPKGNPLPGKIRMIVTSDLTYPVVFNVVHGKGA